MAAEFNQMDVELTKASIEAFSDVFRTQSNI